MGSMKDAMMEQGEPDRDEALATALGITIEELDELDWRLEDHTSKDGLLYGHNVYFGESSDPEVLKKIGGLVNGEWVRIGPL
ncbi:hypothetical protein [Bradyrhizobium sp. SZCCHNR3015]|uniref:hypothetical protein n=1 Tax=Bradyrhizobium sp. SZCCHNR3015 TaxID=3057395 RepID=UPI002916DE41|nr:hypothetical protein [Bradyrhizobium sp. SZCCHNR3015]